MSRLNENRRISGILTTLPHRIKEKSISLMIIDKETIDTKTFVTLRTNELQRNERFHACWLIVMKCWLFLTHSSIVCNSLQTTYVYYVWRPPALIANVNYFLCISWDIIFLIDCIKNMILQRDSYKLWKIIIDVLLCIPFWYLYLLFFNPNEYWLLCLRSLCVLRVYKLVCWFKKQELQAILHRFCLFFVEFGAFFLFWTHILACSWYLIAHPFNSTSTEAISWCANRYFCSYCSALYYSISYNFGLGMKFEMGNKQTILFAFGLISGYFLFAYLISKTFAFYVNANKRQIQLNNEMNEHIQHGMADGDDRQQIRTYYNTLWLNKEGVRRCKLFYLIPASICCDVMYDINLPALKCSVLFRNSPEFYVRQLGGLMKHEFYVRNENILEYGSVKEKMIVIVSGIVELISFDDATVILSFGPGTCLCEAALILTLKSKFILKARKFVEVQALHRSDFLSTIRYYPKQYNKLLKTMKLRIHEKRLKRTNKQMSIIQRLKENKQQQPHEQMYNIVTKQQYGSLIVDEDSTFYTIWQLFIATIALIIASAYPYFIGYQKAIPQRFKTIANIFEFFLVIDLLLLLITCKVKKSLRPLRLKEFIVYKINNWQFYIDLFSCFYFEYFAYAFNNHQYLFYVFKLNRCLKVYKIFAMLNRCAEAIEALRYLKWLLVIVLLQYWFSVLFYMIACFDTSCKSHSWFKQKMLVEQRQLDIAAPIFEQRTLFAYYMALGYFMRFEVHEIVLRNWQDLLASFIIIVIGVFLIALYIADMASIKYLYLIKTLKFIDTMHTLEYFCKSNALPLRLWERLTHYYKLQWKYNKCIDRDYLANGFNEAANQVMLNYLKTIDLFVYFDDGFLSALAKRAKVYLLPPNDILTYYGSMNKEMFIIMEGQCVYKTCGGFYRRIGRQTVIGLCTLFFSLPETSIVRTLTDCKLISIDGSALQQALVLHPQYTHIFKTICKDLLYKQFVKNSTITMPQLSYFPQANIEYTQLSDQIRSLVKRRMCFNVLQYCRKHREKYVAPFQQLNSFAFCKFLLVPITLTSYGLFFLGWHHLRLTSTLLYALLTPIQQINKCGASPPFSTLLMYIDFIAYADLYLMLHLSYYDKRFGCLIIHPVRTSQNYMQTSFLVDFLLALPIDALARRFATDALACRLRLLKILQIYKLFIALRNWRQNFPFRIFWIDFFQYLILVTLLINAFSCILLSFDCNFDGALNRLICQPTSWYSKSVYGARNSTNLLEIHFLTCYWVSNLMLGLNFGDFMVHGGGNLALSLAILLVGLLFYSNVLINLLPHCIIFDMKMLKYQQRMGHLIAFMKQENVDKAMRTKVVENAEHFWRRTKYIEHTNLFSCLHTNLLQDVLSFLYEETLKQVPLFEKMDRSFIRILAMIARPQYYLQGQIIIHSKDIIDEFYIVHRGSVQITFANTDLKMDLMRGSVFGFYNNDLEPTMTIEALTTKKADLLCIKTNDYYNILRNYSKFHYTIKQVTSEYKDFIPNHSIVEQSNKNYQYSKKLKHKFHKMMDEMTITSTFFIYFDCWYVMMSYLNCLIAIAQYTFQTSIFFYYNIMLDCFFILHILMKFWRPFYDDKGELITARNLIKKRYLSKRYEVGFDLSLNLTSLFVLLLFYSSVLILNNFYAFTVLRLLTVLRFVYILQFFTEIRMELAFSQIRLTLWWMFLWTTLLLHYIICLWTLVTCSYHRCNDKTTTNCQRYIDHFYFILNVICGCGGVAVAFKSLCEVAFVIGVGVLSKFALVFICCCFIKIIWYHIKLALNYEYHIKEMESFMNCANISKYQVSKLVTYLKNFWNYDNGQNFPILFHYLPPPVILELKLHIYKSFIQRSYLFADTEDLFIQHICSQFERVLFYPHDIIVHHCQVDESMYFIRRGKVEILTVNGSSETVHDVLHETEMFGLTQGLFNNVPHHFTFRAKTRVELLQLRLADWDFLLRYFERSKDVIYKRIKNLHVQLNV